MKQETIEIFIEQNERLVFRQTTAREIEAMCEACREISLFIAPERAALLFNLTTREIYRRIEGGAIHFFETDGGAAFVCATSLSVNSAGLKKLPAGK